MNCQRTYKIIKIKYFALFMIDQQCDAFYQERKEYNKNQNNNNK